MAEGPMPGTTITMAALAAKKVALSLTERERRWFEVRSSIGDVRVANQEEASELQTRLESGLRRNLGVVIRPGDIVLGKFDSALLGDKRKVRYSMDCRRPLIYPLFFQRPRRRKGSADARERLRRQKKATAAILDQGRRRAMSSPGDRRHSIDRVHFTTSDEEEESTDENDDVVTLQTAILDPMLRMQTPIVIISTAL